MRERQVPAGFVFQFKDNGWRGGLGVPAGEWVEREMVGGDGRGADTVCVGSCLLLLFSWLRQQHLHGNTLLASICTRRALGTSVLHSQWLVMLSWWLCTMTRNRVSGTNVPTPQQKDSSPRSLGLGAPSFQEGPSCHQEKDKKSWKKSESGGFSKPALCCSRKDIWGYDNKRGKGL